MNNPSKATSNKRILALTALAVLAAFIWRFGRISSQASPALSEQLAAAEQPSAALPRLLEMGSDSCASCKAMMPVLDELRAAHSEQLAVEFIDVWKHPEQGEAHDVQIIPTQLFLSPSGEELARHEGFYSADSIRDRWTTLGYSLGAK